MVPGPLPHPLLLADIGGTNARFALVASPGDPPGPVLRLATGDFVDAESAFSDAIRHFGVRPGTVVCASAGPREGSQIALTNADWIVDMAALAARFQCGGVLFNDFEALALALPFLNADTLVSIGPWNPMPAGVRVAVGPGTGLGVAALVDAAGRFMPLPSEGAHVGFGPLSRDEERLFRQVERVEGRITAEVLLSGAGLVRLHAARMALQDRGSSSRDAAALTAEALGDPKGDAAGTVRLFLALLARFAGDLAITFRAEGGVFIGGGIVPRLMPLLDPQAFRMNFEAKAPVDGLARKCPIAMIRGEAALIGLAAYGAAPSRFLIPDDGRTA
jgi:glucokinase